MTEDDIFKLYRTSFIPIYSDFVSLTATKAQQILIEQENVLAHISQSQNRELSDGIRRGNLTKAYNHIVRMTLDVHKLVWAETKARLDKFVLNNKKRLAFNLSESEVFHLYAQFINGARDARKHEMEHVGHIPESSIAMYDDVNKIGNELLGKLDDIKAASITHWSRILKTREFIIGVSASLVAAVIVAVIALVCS